MIEVEVKYRVSREVVDHIVSKLLSIGGVPLSEEVQEDFYFQHPSRDFAVTDEALRVRRVGDKVDVTYKGPRIDHKSKTREEIRVRVESLDDFILLLERLGFLQVAKVIKTRKTYRLGETLLHLDRVNGVGFFIEIEATVEKKDEVERKRDELLSKAEKLGIPAESFERRSYLEIILGI
ncbi:MAG: class IV adenylate cyclase [Candidatus Freyarchaeota archaeon]|nr:class IV adenylate cyclase [Candidatus Jordarchaeia archaeon]